MAIEIIEEKPDPGVVRECVCDRCGVRLRYVPGDVQKKNYRDYGGTADTAYWIVCPKCSREISVGPAYA